MYVAIDQTDMRVAYKHPSAQVLLDLVALELPHHEVTISPEGLCLAGMTELDIKLLHKCIYNSERAPYNAIAQIVEYISAMPEVDVNPFELQCQARNAAGTEPRLYVKGATRASTGSSLFAGAPAAQRTAAGTNTPAAPRDRAQRPAAPPKKGSVRDTIWEVADQLWAEAGKPTERGLVLALRKNAMQVLEDLHGVKKTTSSNELGNWQKTRI